MIAYLKGKIIFQDTFLLIIQTDSGLGYEVRTAATFEIMSENDSKVELFIEHVIREDHQILFGFKTMNEKKMFQLLNSVNGVGPKTAFTIITSIPGESLIHSILQDDISIFKSVSGVGPKTAKQIVLQLKDKIEKTQTMQNPKAKKKSSSPWTSSVNHPAIPLDTPLYEGILALESLGFSSQEAKTKLEKILFKHPTIATEDLIKSALSEKY